jgi:transposase InsO family protein
VLSVKSECLNRVIPLSENHLRSTITAFVRHYHSERPHQGLNNCLIDADETAERLVGMLVNQLPVAVR